jgi:eukaryotic-like serine/threonine-protein kinase
MPLTAGTRLGSYLIDAPLGAGGMGEVYRARDTRLGRDVAVKVLAGVFAHDPSRRERFEQEARSVAALNHPNILALHDVGTDGDVAFMVTELVDGHSLRHASLSPRKIMEIAAQLADGLAAAHAAGVTHRDLKPDNVMITRDGRPKILDFGLAKLAEQPDSAMTRIQTEGGMVLGTAGYMAPEQVRGAGVDARTDIFAFGAMLYELLAARPAFDGATSAEIMTAILRHEPPELPTHVPPAARQIVRRCLEKNPEERFQSARDLAFALRHLTGSSGIAETIPAVQRTWPRSRTFVSAAAFAAGAVLAGALVFGWSATRDDGVDPVQVTRIAADRLNELAPAFSPDGRTVAYLRAGGGLTELVVHPVDALTPITLVRSPESLQRPHWFPDGNRVCYTASGLALMCVGAAGGTPQLLLRPAFSPRFTPDGQRVFFIRVHEGQPWLFRSATTGNDAERLGEGPLPPDISGLSPISPDGSTLIAFGPSSRWLVSAVDGTRRVLPVGQGVRTVSVSWLPDGRHVAVAEETDNPMGSRLLIVDTESPARRLVVRGVDPITAVTASPDGTRLVYSGGPVERNIAEYSSDGSLVRPMATSSNLEGFPSWAPDGERFVYRVGGPGQSASLWMGAADGTPSTPIVQLGFNFATPARIAPDGGRIAYADTSGVHVVSTAGGRAIRVSPDGPVQAVCWSPDGEWIWYESSPVTLRKVPSQGGVPVPVKAGPGVLRDCSPDGRWLARTGRDGRLVLTSTDGADERQIAEPGEYVASGGIVNLFGEGGKVLYLLRADRRTIDVRDVETGRTLRSITFDLPAEDEIVEFAIHPAGARVLLTTGGSRYDLWMAEGFAQPVQGWTRWFRRWESPSAPPPLP